jgi:N-acetylglucosamine-6-phosphate deacetylase
MTARGIKLSGKISGQIAMPDGSLLRGHLNFTDRITSLDPDPNVGDDYILPGFIDLQVNGSHGIDVMSAPPDSLVNLARRLAREGTTAFLPTAVTSPLEKIARVHRSIASAIETSSHDSAASNPDYAAILGMHLEGPFISPLRLGAHPPLNLDPHGEAFESVIAMDALRLLTLAPELPGALDATMRLSARNVIVSIGHTNATLDEANAGIAAGARMFTHTFNAMRPLNHRDPGVIAAALAPSRAFAAIIPDGVHVHPSILNLAYRARGRDGMLLVTDKVVLAGTAEASSVTVGRAPATIRDGAVRLANGTLAGSIISMLDGVRMIVENTDASIADAAMMASTNPAILLGATDRGRLQPKARADLVVLSAKLELKSVFIGGHEIS